MYIGYCLGDWKKRWKNGSGYHTNKCFHEAIRRIGAKNFTHEVLASGLTYVEALDLERQMIHEYDSTDPEKGYNVIVSEEHSDPYHYSVYTLHAPNGKCYAGYTGMKLEKRWKNGSSYQQNAALYEDILYYGWDRFIKEINAEHLDAASARNFEYYLIRRYDLTDPAKGYNQNYGGFSAKGRSLTGKERQKLQKKFSSRPVRCVETGKIYTGIREAARAVGIGHQCISAACNGKTKTSAGFHWEFAADGGKGKS